MLVPLGEAAGRSAWTVVAADDRELAVFVVDGEYHVTDAQTFYEGGERWKVPEDPAGSQGSLQPPYYLSIGIPGDSSDEPPVSSPSQVGPVGLVNSTTPCTADGSSPRAAGVNCSSSAIAVTWGSRAGSTCASSRSSIRPKGWFRPTPQPC